jgi:hypothetical protein
VLLLVSEEGARRPARIPASVIQIPFFKTSGVHTCSCVKHQLFSCESSD